VPAATDAVAAATEVPAHHDAAPAAAPALRSAAETVAASNAFKLLVKFTRKQQHAQVGNGNCLCVAQVFCVALVGNVNCSCVSRNMLMRALLTATGDQNRHVYLLVSLHKPIFPGVKGSLCGCGDAWV
jgi:hypothetical protein